MRVVRARPTLLREARHTLSPALVMCYRGSPRWPRPWEGGAGSAAGGRVGATRWLTRHVARGALAAARALMGLAALAQLRDAHRPRLVSGAGGATHRVVRRRRHKRREELQRSCRHRQRRESRTHRSVYTNFSPLCPLVLLLSCSPLVGTFSLPPSLARDSGVSNVASRSCCVVSARVVLTLVVVCGAHRGRSSIARVCRPRSSRVLPERAQRRRRRHLRGACNVRVALVIVARVAFSSPCWLALVSEAFRHSDQSV